MLGAAQETMDFERIIEALRRRPFERFVIRLVDGRSIRVTSHEAVAVGSRRIIVVNPDETLEVLAPPMIVSLDYNGAKARRTKAGRGRKG